MTKVISKSDLVRGKMSTSTTTPTVNNVKSVVKPVAHGDPYADMSLYDAIMNRTLYFVKIPPNVCPKNTPMMFVKYVQKVMQQRYLAGRLAAKRRAMVQKKADALKARSLSTPKVGKLGGVMKVKNRAGFSKPGTYVVRSYTRTDGTSVCSHSKSYPNVHSKVQPKWYL